MTTSDSSTVNDSSQHHHSRKSCCSKGNWSGLNIAAMVVGFVFFWPVGLFLLFWTLTGRDVRDIPSAAQDTWSAVFNGASSGSRGHKDAKGENSMFDEFQQTQRDRIAELKKEIKDRARRFRDFRSAAKRRADEAEFSEFMSSDRSKDDQ